MAVSSIAGCIAPVVSLSAVGMSGASSEWSLSRQYRSTCSKMLLADRSLRDMMISAVVGGSAIEFEMITRSRSFDRGDLAVSKFGIDRKYSRDGADEVSVLNS